MAVYLSQYRESLACTGPREVGEVCGRDEGRDRSFVASGKGEKCQHKNVPPFILVLQTPGASLYSLPSEEKMLAVLAQLDVEELR